MSSAPPHVEIIESHRPSALSDWDALALAAAVWLGAAQALPVPLLIAVAVVAVAFLLRQPVVLVVAGLLLAMALGARAEAGLVPPPAAAVYEEVTLLSDPVDERGAVRVDVRVGPRRVEAWARGAPASALRERAAGERVVVSGRLRPPSEGARAWLARRHISARLSVDEVGAWSLGDPASRAANRLRRALHDGAEPLGPERQALLAGFVLGDDRGQSVEVTDDFRGSGLTHLLAVSGDIAARGGVYGCGHWPSARPSSTWPTPSAGPRCGAPRRRVCAFTAPPRPDRPRCSPPSRPRSSA